MVRRSNPVKRTRRSLYKIARVMGDYTAITGGTFHRRIVRRLVGKISSRGMAGLFHKMFKG